MCIHRSHGTQLLDTSFGDTAYYTRFFSLPHCTTLCYRCVLEDQSGPDVVQLQRQMERGRIDPEKLEDVWEGSRERILRWLIEIFDRHHLKEGSQLAILFLKPF